MYLFYLCPLPVKANPFLYSWMSLPALNGFYSTGMGVIGRANQLGDPSSMDFPSWIVDLVGPLRASYDWQRVTKIVVPEEMVTRIAEQAWNPKQLLVQMVKDGFQELIDLLYAELSMLKERVKVEAVITFVNCRSLELACRFLDIPVIHMEAGFIREPTWRISTFQFDFSGVNGNTEAASRFRLDVGRADRASAAQIAQTLLTSGSKEHFTRSLCDYTYEFGIPMQVDDDSNLLAFANGYTNLDTLYIARQVFPPHLILVRNHPLGLFKFDGREDLGALDNSLDSLQFVAKCKRILTINSSVAFEALLMGRETYILGDSPLSEVAYNRVDRHLRGEHLRNDLVEKYLDFIAFQYLIPRQLWMNKEYCDFRISKPTEDDIRRTHVEAIRDQLLLQ